jgi:hypothetical protein
MKEPRAPASGGVLIYDVSLHFIFAMRTAFLLTIALPLTAQVKITQLPDRLAVEIDGKPFTAFFTGSDVAKPYLWPLRAASGTSVTRSGQR